MQRGRRLASDQLHRALSLRLSLLRKMSDSGVRCENSVPLIVQNTPPSPAESPGRPGSSIAPGPALTQDDVPPLREEQQQQNETGRLRPPTSQSFERVSSSDLDADADDDSAGIGLLEQNIVFFAVDSIYAASRAMSSYNVGLYSTVP